MLPLHLRPENRERRRHEEAAWPDTTWLDTHPALHRSEAFAEDLPVLVDVVVPAPCPAWGAGLGF